MAKQKRLIVGGERVRVGETRDIRLSVSESYTGEAISIPVRIIRARKPGPRVFLTSAIHGDEINGTGIIRELLFGDPLILRAGALICLPVVNIFGFESQSRYMPDRRDLNRSFPGSASGSLSSRVANVLYEEVIRKCDYGLDLHSAGATRTNFPNVRGDLKADGVERIATSFGCELIVNGKGPEGSLRRCACKAGCPTIILEAGEIAKMEPAVLELGKRGVRNVLIELGMLRGRLIRPSYQTKVNRTTWIRAELGGLLRFHVAPGDMVAGGQPIASNESVFGDARSVLIAPRDGIVLGMTTYPAVKPGEPVCHLAVPRQSVKKIRRSMQQSPNQVLWHRLRDHLAANINVSNEH